MLKDIKSIPIKQGNGSVVYNGNGAITIFEAEKEFEDSVSPSKSIWINTYDLRQIKDLLNSINLD